MRAGYDVSGRAAGARSRDAKFGGHDAHERTEGGEGAGGDGEALLYCAPDGDVEGRPEEVWVGEFVEEGEAHDDGGGGSGETSVFKIAERVKGVSGLHASHGEQGEEHHFRRAC